MADIFNQDLSKWDVRNVDYFCGYADKARKWDLPKPNFENSKVKDVKKGNC